jgi:hypothetical protein
VVDGNAQLSHDDGDHIKSETRAVPQQEGKTKLQVDYDHMEKVTIELWQVELTTTSP